MLIGKVIVDIASSLVDKVFDYILTDENIAIGSRVIVPFGKIEKEGYLIDITDHSDYETEKLKPITRAMDNFPVILPEQLELVKFLKRTYHIGICDSLRLFLPSELRLGKVKELTQTQGSGISFKGAFQRHLGYWHNPSTSAKRLTDKDSTFKEVLLSGTCKTDPRGHRSNQN